MDAAFESAPPPPRRARSRSSSGESSGEGSRAPRREPKPAERPPTRWLWMIPLLCLGLLSLLAVLSYDPSDAGAFGTDRQTHNWVGPAGHGLAWALFEAVGVSAYGVALGLLVGAVLACTQRGLRLAPLATVGTLLLGTVTSALAHLLSDPSQWPYPPGGVVGRVIGDATKGAFSMAGALIVLFGLLLISLLLATHFAAARAFDAAARGVGGVGRFAAHTAFNAYQRRREARLARQEEEETEPRPSRRGKEAGPDARLPVALDGAAVVEVAPEELRRKPRRKGETTESTEAMAVVETPEPRVVLPPNREEAAPTVTRNIRQEPASAGAIVARTPAPLPAIARASDETTALENISPEAPTEPPVVARNISEDKTAPANDDGIVAPLPAGLRAPTIIEPRAPPAPLPTNRPAAEPTGPFRMKGGATGFHIPAVDAILEGETHSTRQIDRGALTATATKLVQKLNTLGVPGEVTEIRPGPVVTMYEFKPADGIKLSRIASLGDDLAMAMEALRVRIVAPIPGKGVVGFEVPNRTRETVFLKEVVEQEAFQKGASRLTMAIGKDIEGLPYVSDLAKMPHLLIAGTTGSGKSVGVNAMLVSMLMRATPEELRFIMVDPKMLELSIYEGIPHLLLPVVTDPKKAAMALRWGVEEMERRYELLAAAGVRNIAQYNKHVEKVLADPPEASDGDAPAEPLRKLPYIVIVIDELADLMMVAAKEVEVYIARLAQMARAAGLHLMVATQRPSTDVLTGVIKANFPSRISFQVASRHDSGTIINTPGAENLLGMGDMLILPPGTSSLTRVHGAYVSEAEINKLTGFWKAQGAPVYDPEILRPRDDEGGGDMDDDGGPDELYDQAIAAVSEMKTISVSLLQRKMRIGYNRSARMIERMERDGIVGPADGAKPREVLIRRLGEMPGD